VQVVIVTSSICLPQRALPIADQSQTTGLRPGGSERSGGSVCMSASGSTYGQ